MCTGLDLSSSRELIRLLDEKKAKTLAAKDDEEPLAAPGAYEHVARGALRNAPVLVFQVILVL